ncbi:MAG: hypothetical protein IRZ16_23130 [Myxococcaceae bacterium]|nr:hypothetical protein [Myxococcaceae bacterium]
MDASAPPAHQTEPVDLRPPPPPPPPPDPSTAPLAPIEALDGAHEVISLEGTLVSQTSDEVVMRDGNGNEHHLRVTRHTRYVWSETTAPGDLVPGARVRADYTSVRQQQLLVSLWILGRS